MAKLGEDGVIGWIREIVLDSPDPHSLASFWASLLGGTPVHDLASAHRRVIASGGTFAGEHVSPRRGPGGELVRWRVYRDPAGHPFCLVTR